MTLSQMNRTSLKQKVTTPTNLMSDKVVNVVIETARPIPDVGSNIRQDSNMPSNVMNNSMVNAMGKQIQM